jgi:MFS superfamily sulfate permease-like transporter
MIPPANWQPQIQRRKHCYALLGPSRQLADRTLRASLAGGMVALLCLIAWLLRLSVLVRLISDSILVGFEAGAGLTIAMTQVPSLLGVPGGGNNFFERAVLLADQLGRVQYLVLALGLVAILLLVLGERLLPARPVGGLDRLRTLDDLLGSIDR